MTVHVPRHVTRDLAELDLSATSLTWMKLLWKLFDIVLWMRAEEAASTYLERGSDGVS